MKSFLRGALVAALAVVQTVAGVVRLGNDGVEGAAVERRVHFVGDLFEPTAQHGQGDRVHGSGL